MRSPAHVRYGSAHRGRRLLPALRPGPRSTIALLVAGMAASVALAACYRPATPPDAARVPTDTAAIAVALDPMRPGMESIYLGVALAIETLNADRGDAPLLVMRRAPEEMSSAVAIATELQRDPMVVGVVGHPESGASLEALPVYEDLVHDGLHALAVVSPTATSPRLSGRSPWFFRVCPTDITASETVARYVVDTLGLRRASVIYRNDSYGRDWSDSFTNAFEQAGGTVLHRDPYVRGVTEWEAYAGLVRQLGAEVLLFPGSAEDAVLAIRALRDAGAGEVAFVGGDAISALEEEGSEFAGARYTAFFDPERPASAAAARFIAAFQRAHGRLPDQRAALAYDAAMLIGQAVHEAGPDRARVRDALAAVGRTRSPLDGATGQVAFDENNDVVDRTVVVAAVTGR